MNTGLPPSPEAEMCSSVPPGIVAQLDIDQIETGFFITDTILSTVSSVSVSGERDVKSFVENI
jgi:hypothetical protein